MYVTKEKDGGGGLELRIHFFASCLSRLCNVPCLALWHLPCPVLHAPDLNFTIEIYHLWTVAARDPLSGREALHGNTGKSTCHLMMSVFPIGLPRKLLGAAAVGL
jgi:hypothetical protein